jgi:hypothetical protein
LSAHPPWHGRGRPPTAPGMALSRTNATSQVASPSPGAGGKTEKATWRSLSRPDPGPQCGQSNSVRGRRGGPGTRRWDWEGRPWSGGCGLLLRPLSVASDLTPGQRSGMSSAPLPHLRRAQASFTSRAWPRAWGVLGVERSHHGRGETTVGVCCPT